MTIEDIQNNVAALNAASSPAPKAKAKKKSAAAPAGIATAFASDELHLRTLSRVVAALNLERKGITAEILVAGVKQYEAAA